jgi:hypothetical protein
MVLIIPRAMPSRGAAQQEFEIQRVHFEAPEAGGALGGIQAGSPRWLATWSLGRVGAGGSDEWRAWLAGMRGGMRRFYGRDFARPYPKKHLSGFAGMVRPGGAAFDGSATAWAEQIDAEGNSLVTLAGLPAGLILSAIDYIGFKWDAAGRPAGTHERRALIRVEIGGVVAANGSVTVRCEPAVPLVVPPAAKAHLDNPVCVMGIVPEGTKLGGIDRSLAIRSGTIVGIQDIRA